MDNKIIEKIALIFAGVLAYMSTLQEASATVIESQSFDDIYKRQAGLVGIDWKLMKAVAMVESTENPNAVNPADPSVGLFQILCKKDANGYCSNNLNIRDWPAKYEDLFIPEVNAYYAAQILAWNINTYGLLKGIAVYNSWGARNDEPGNFRNQSYVDKVVGNYVTLGGKVY